MSGDVQPRKRKEKRRKREDEDAGTPPPTLVGPTEDVNIHVHKEGGTGGHWCAKIVFFVLFTVLVGLVGVIIFEARGSTDVDTPVASSRWAMIFEGFVDDSVSLHEESHGKEEHEVSHEEEEEEGEHDDEHDEEAEEDHDGDHEEEEDEHGGSQEVEASEEQQDEGQEEEGDDGVDNEEDVGEDQEEDQGEDEDNEVDNQDNEDEDEEAHLNDSGTLEEVEEEEAPSREAEQEEEDDGEDQNSQEETELLDMSVEGIDPSFQDDDDDDGNEDLPYEFFGIPGVNEIDDDAEEPLEEVDDQEIEEITNNDPLDFEPEKDEEMEEEESSVAVKFAVGVALVVAAHVVLVRRWSDVEAELAAYNSEVPADLSRRDTIISPTPLISRVQAKEPVSQQEAKADAKNFTQHATKDIAESKITSIPQRREVDLDTSESERHSGTEEDINYDSEEEEEDEEDEEEDDIVELDDTELVAKLEAKYGKIPTPSQSEEEATGDDDEEGLDDEEDLEDEEDEDEEDEESEEEESGEHYDWKHVRAPKTHSGPQPTEHESRSREPRGRSGGKQEHRDFYNTSEVDEAVMQEELENWLMRDFDN